MKISELISHLQDLFDLHGDLPVTRQDPLRGYDLDIGRVELETTAINSYGELVTFHRIVLKR